MTTRIIWFGWGATAATVIWFLPVPEHKIAAVAVIAAIFALDASLRYWLRRRRHTMRHYARRP